MFSPTILMPSAWAKIDHHINYEIVKQHFGSWILLPPSGGKGGKEDRKPICSSPLSS
jgi:hypothetical protein